MSRHTPNEDATLIRYLTAHVSGKADAGAPPRQETYPRALATLALVRIPCGNLLSGTTRMPLANPRRRGAKTVEVIRTEEKGSDVNLAFRLLWDAFAGRCGAQVLISDDSDACETIRIAHDELGMRVGVVNPHRRQPSRLLNAKADFTKQVSVTALAASQFPDPVIQVGHKPLFKPATW